MKTSKDYFYEDLNVGEAIEYEILKKIQNGQTPFKEKYPKAYKPKVWTKEYDLIIPEINKTVEVKQDFKAKDTNNIVVEIEFGGNPSGLSVTNSDYWVITDGYWIYWIELEKLKKCVDDFSYTLTGWKGPGDTKYKRAYLVDRYDFIGYCINPVFRLKKDDPLYRDNFIKRKLKEQ